MLQKLNERIHGMVAWVIVALIAFTFVLFGVDYLFQTHQSSGALAEVNGQPIVQSEFERDYRQLRQQDSAVMSAVEDERIKKQLLEELILKSLTIQAAKQTGFYVSPEQVNAAVFQIPQFQEEGHFSSQRFQQVLAASMYTPDLLRKEVKQGMLINQQRFAFLGSAFVMPSELARYAGLLLETRDYTYTILSSKRFLPQPVKVSEQQAKVYYTAHLADFISPPLVSVDYLMLSLANIKSTIVVPPEDIQRYYKDNQSSFKKPAQWKVAHLFYAFSPNASAEEQAAVKQKAAAAYHILKQDPGKFSEFVKKESDDRLTAQHEGELPSLTAGQSEFDQVLVSLTQKNDVSQPFQTEKGMEIFKLLAYAPSSELPYSQASDLIREQLLNEQAQSRYAKALESLGELSYQNPDTLEPASTALHLPILHTPLFDKTGGTENASAKAITQNPDVLRAAFSQDVHDLGNNSEPIQLDPTTVIVLRDQQKRPAKRQPFQDVKAQIEQIIMKQTKKAELERLGLNLIQGKAALPADLTWQRVEHQSLDGKVQDTLIRELVFSLKRAGQLAGSMQANDDYVLVRLEAVHVGQLQDLSPEKKQALTQQLASTYGAVDYDLYIRGLLDNAKIKRM